MLRRVKRPVSKQASAPMQSPSSLVYGRVNGPYPAPKPASSIVLPGMNMNMNVGVQGGRSSGCQNGAFDDFRALHYRGLDAYDNIEF